MAWGHRMGREGQEPANGWDDRVQVWRYLTWAAAHSGGVHGMGGYRPSCAPDALQDDDEIEGRLRCRLSPSPLRVLAVTRAEPPFCCRCDAAAPAGFRSRFC
ncbi:hypothetical protein GCM10023205_76960 [Yinghuangia aomiensis]|uniref:Uncharacterized protein n=1 Tax=Yinghuangia aomiensis TaxID=676205 RepID=A0ABP9I9X9_9ACTN